MATRKRKPTPRRAKKPAKKAPAPIELFGEAAYKSLKPALQRFADLVAGGADHGPAWTASGRTANPKAAKAAASRALLTNATLRNAVEWLRSRDAEKAGLSREKWLRIADEILSFDPLLAEEWARGEKSLADMTPAQRRAIVSLSIDPSGKRRIRAVNPIEALRVTAAPLGLATQKNADPTPEEARRALAQMFGITEAQLVAELEAALGGGAKA